MNPNVAREPERWSERAGEVTAEDAIGAAFRRIRTATEPSSMASMRWARNAMAPLPRGVGPRLWATAIAATVLVGGGAVAGVAWHASVTNARAREAGVQAAAQAETRRAAPRRAVASPGATAAPADQLLPDPAPMLAPAPAAALEPAAPARAPVTGARQAGTRARRVALELGPAAAPMPVAGPTPDTEPPPAAATAGQGDDEAQLVARAFRHLRNEGDAPAALAALDERQRRFGAGGLAAEAALARVEALLLLGRTADALPVLLAIRDTRSAQTPEVRATRAELLTRAQRCDEAAPDFDALLAPGAPAAARERALYARASCRLQSAQPLGAVPDLESYLAEFPDGRSAPTVRAALERLRRP